MTIDYKYNGEIFAVSKPDNCTMKVSRNGLTAEISVSESTSKFQVVVEGASLGPKIRDDAQSAVDAACYLILSNQLPKRPKKELCAELDRFFEQISQ